MFPVHPRTRTALERAGDRRARARASGSSIRSATWSSWRLVAASAGVLTDSGGIQEETTYLGIPCFTLRDNTERPVTIELGTNVLLGLAPERIAEVPALLRSASGERRVPAGWDGHAAERIVDVLSGWATQR